MPNQVRNLKRINIVKQRQRRTIMGKRMANQKTWYIGKENNSKTYYVCEHDSNENTTLWGINRDDALSFKTERAIHKFIKKFMPNRTDIMLVSVEN